MSERTFRQLLADLIQAACGSGLSPSFIHDELVVAGMGLDDNRVEVEEPDVEPAPY